MLKVIINPLLQHVSRWASTDFSSILHKNFFYFFYFTYPFLQNKHISLSILHIYSIKYWLFYKFLLFSSLPPLSLTDPSLLMIPLHLATIITTQPASSRKTNPLNPKPNQSQTHSSPTQPETHWRFDLHGLMIEEAFVWWFDRCGWWSAWFDDRLGSMIGGNGWSAWSNDWRSAWLDDLSTTSKRWSVTIKDDLIKRRKGE